MSVCPPRRAGDSTNPSLAPRRRARTPALPAAILLAAGTLGGMSSAKAADWTVTNLHPAGVGGDSWAFGVSGGQQVGVVGAGGGGRASLWSGTAASRVDLHPAGFVHSNANGVGGGQQVGSAVVNQHAHAALWGGTAASFVDLSPAGSPDSYAHGVSGGQQVGQAIVNDLQRVGMWSGTAASWVDLTPDGLFGGVAYRISGGQQVGYTWDGGDFFRASLWSGTAASWVNLTPAGSPDAEARGVFGGQQVGYAQVGSVPHAGLWSGTAASWVDLHALLPPGFSESVAQSIWRDASFTYVAGYGMNDGFQQALLWTQPVPEPGSATTLAAAGGLFVAARCRRSGRRQSVT